MFLAALGLGESAALPSAVLPGPSGAPSFPLSRSQRGRLVAGALQGAICRPISKEGEKAGPLGLSQENCSAK